MITRRSLLWGASAAAIASALPFANGETPPTKNEAKGTEQDHHSTHGQYSVAFLISQGSNVIDMAGPWEVFQDAMTAGEHAHPFKLFTVAENSDPVRATGGLHLVPDFSLENAPQPDVIVIPAMRGSPKLHEWVRSRSTKSEITMSVCTGAFQLGRARLLDGLAATTHHDFWDSFEKEFPKVKLKRGMRFVENGKIATAGGLTSGIDLALRIVERLCGRDAALNTAKYMEYQSDAWRRA